MTSALLDSGTSLVEGRACRDCAQLLCRPLRDSTLLYSLPGPDVPGLPVSPLRGWRNRAVEFVAVLGFCDTDSSCACPLGAGRLVPARCRPALPPPERW